MLHHNQGVADVPQVLQGCQEFVVVPLVQTDGGLVQNIQHTHQGGTDLGSQANPLAFAAGQSARRPGQGQIAQAHVRQELEPGFDLLDDLLGNQRHVPFQLEIAHKFQAVPNAQAAEVHNADAANGHRPGDLRQPVAAALWAGRGSHALLQLLPGGVGLGLLIPPGDVVEDTLKWLLQHTHTIAPVVGDLQLFTLGAVEDNVHYVPWQLLHRHRQGEVVLLGQGLKIHPEDGIRPGTLPAAGLDGPFKNRLVLVGDHQVLVGDELEAQAGAAGTGPAGIIEGKHSGLQLRQADAAVLAGVVLGEAQLLPGLGQLNGD